MIITRIIIRIIARRKEKEKERGKKEVTHSLLFIFWAGGFSLPKENHQQKKTINYRSLTPTPHATTKNKKEKRES